jgi:hypothetical protein
MTPAIQDNNEPKKCIKIQKDLTVKELTALLEIQDSAVKHLFYQMNTPRTVSSVS